MPFDDAVAFPGGTLASGAHDAGGTDLSPCGTEIRHLPEADEMRLAAQSYLTRPT